MAIDSDSLSNQGIILYWLKSIKDKVCNILYDFIYKFVKILKLAGIKIGKYLIVFKHLLFV